MFNCCSKGGKFLPLGHSHTQPYYEISQELVNQLARYIQEEEDKLKSEGFLQNEDRHEYQNNLQKAAISIPDDTDAGQELDDDDKTQPQRNDQPHHNFSQKEDNSVDPDCVEVPTVNLELPNPTEQSMANYKINRQKYHFFCHSQALKQEQARRQRKERKALRKDGQPDQEKRTSKSKAWKAQAASTKRMLGSAPPLSLPAQPQQATILITKDNILIMFQLSPQQATSVGYQAAAGEDLFYSSVFQTIRADMQTARIYKLRETNLSKMRTFIVRRVLDDFVAQRFEDSPSQKQHLARHNRRITRVDRSRYMQAGIPEPPSRMKSHYLHTIFQNQQFRTYYVDYLSSERLRLYMVATNQEMAQKYWQQVTTIASKQAGLQERLTLFREIKRKPLFLTQIVEYLEEAAMIRIQYCKDKSKKE